MNESGANHFILRNLSNKIELNGHDHHTYVHTYALNLNKINFICFFDVSIDLLMPKYKNAMLKINNNDNRKSFCMCQQLLVISTSLSSADVSHLRKPEFYEDPAYTTSTLPPPPHPYIFRYLLQFNTQI